MEWVHYLYGRKSMIKIHPSKASPNTASSRKTYFLSFISDGGRDIIERLLLDNLMLTRTMITSNGESKKIYDKLRHPYGKEGP
jgi:hypothetical protein